MNKLFSLNFIQNSCNKIYVEIELMCQNKTKKKIFWGITVLGCYFVLLALNMLTPLISDDFAYLFIYGEDVRITSLADIVQSQINHYYMWGGRSIVHFIAQVLLMLPPYIADLLNASVYMAYVFFIYYHIKGRGKSSISLFVLINLSVWFFQPVIGDTIFWITGAANYLWGTFFILLFLLPYRLYEGKNMALRWQVLSSFGLFMLGIVAGWTNENTAGAMILIVILFLLYYHSHKWKIPSWGIVGLIGSIIGYAIMILAPGNFERAGGASSLDFTVMYRLFNYTLTFVYYCGPLILVCLIILILFYHFPSRDRKEILKLNFIYCIAAIAAVYVMLFSPTFPRRALFGVVTYLIIGAGFLYYNLNFQYKFLRQIRLTIILFGLLSFVFTFYLAVKEISAFKNITQEREIVIKRAKEQGITFCEFERYDGGSYIHGEDPFSEQLMTRYYGIKIKLKHPN